MAGAGKKTFTAGEVLTASDVNTYLMEQSVMVFGGTAARSSAIPTPSEGMTTYRTDTQQIESYDGANWIGMSGLQLVKKQTIGSAVSSVTVTGAFSATYENYKVIIAGGANSVDNAQIQLQLGSTTSSYIYSFGVFSSGFAAGVGSTSAANFANAGEIDTNKLVFNVEIINPFLSKQTVVNGLGGYNLTNNNSRTAYQGVLPNTTSYTAFTLIASSGAMTGGTIYVYGYGT